MSKKILLAAGAAALCVMSAAGLAWSQTQPRPDALYMKPGPMTAITQPDKAAPVVSVTGGKTAGGIYGDMAVYRAIPFAAPPVGDLRWRAPQPVKPWSDVRKGVEFGSSCGLAEDCLYLNVHTPANAKPGAKLPVMVWIYGGGFTAGSGDAYDSSPFTKNGIIYVSFNYRLGRTGWYTSSAITKNAPKGEVVGNYGMLDQIAALKWVKANIAKFGGDPNHVTAFGESAGGISINYLMTAPMGKGLFQQALSESGFARWPARPLADANAEGDAFFAQHGIRGDGPDALAKLRALPFSVLSEPLALGDGGPILDGKLLQVATIEEGFAKGLDLKIPYVLGGNSNEASLFPTKDPAGRLAKLKAASPSVSAAYDSVGNGDVNHEISAIVTDFYITEPDRAVARLHAKHSPTFRYFVSYVPVAQRGKVYGLGHGGEIGYVFARPNALATPEEMATSQSMIAYWSAFAKYGNPGAAGGTTWPKYDASEPTLEFSVTGPKVDNDLQKARLDWSEANHALVMDSAPHLIPPPPAMPAGH